MNRFLRTLATSLALAATLAFAPMALAGEAQDLVQSRRSQVADMMKSPPSADRDKKVAAVLGSLFDFPAMAEQSLGKHWADLKEEQRTEFTNVLKQLVQRNIEKNVKTTLNYDVQFLGEDGSGETVLVKTKAASKSNAREEPILIDYKLHKASDGWRATDVITEGSSLVGNYRTQFNRIIAKDGFDALIKKMKDKLKREALRPAFGRPIVQAGGLECKVQNAQRKMHIGRLEPIERARDGGRAKDPCQLEQGRRPAVRDLTPFAP
jgi:phospholipid transport system substrate-binding protein